MLAAIVICVSEGASMSADPDFRQRRDAVVTPAVPHFHFVLLLGLVAAATAITAIIFNDQTSAAWASGALLGVAGWIAFPLLRGTQQR